LEDVVIVGAGSAGLALAYELKRRGIRPTLLDEAARVAEPWRRRHPRLRLNTAQPATGPTSGHCDCRREAPSRLSCCNHR
jgi:cation diffusion facilitator CzcD-associated flavoprotein CzcO